MSNDITNAELLRAMERLESRFDKLESKMDAFRFWLIGVVLAIILGGSFTIIGFLL